jgi:6-pyruvoyl-tetrahydropterin synthase
MDKKNNENEENDLLRTFLTAIELEVNEGNLNRELGNYIEDSYLILVNESFTQGLNIAQNIIKDVFREVKKELSKKEKEMLNNIKKIIAEKLKNVL